MFSRIMIVVDSRPVSRAAVVTGVELARVHGAQVHFFSLLPHYPVPLADAPLWTAMSEDDFDQAARSQVQRLHAAAAVVADRAGVSHRSASGRGNDEAACVVQAATKHRCGLIVVATEGRNAVARLMWGSVIPGLITASPIPVMVCRSAPGGVARRRAKAGTARAVKTPRRSGA